MECAENGLRPGEAEATAAPSNALDPRRPGSGGPGCPGLASSGWGRGREALRFSVSRRGGPALEPCFSNALVALTLFFNSNFILI